MRLKSLTNAELIEQIIWSQIDARVRNLESRYEGQPKDEQYKEYCELHEIYNTYWDEAFRRGMVEHDSKNPPRFKKCERWCNDCKAFDWSVCEGKEISRKLNEI